MYLSIVATQEQHQEFSKVFELLRHILLIVYVGNRLDQYFNQQ